MVLELAEELARPVQQPGAQRGELGLPEQEVLADAGVELPDGLHGEVEPGLLAVPGGREVVVGPHLHGEHDRPGRSWRPPSPRRRRPRPFASS